MISKSRRPKAYSYVRLSTDAQLKGDGLRRQIEGSQAYASENNLDLDDTFRLTDKGISAFKGDNAATGALSRFVDAVQTGKIERGSYLIVESFDRLSRDRVSAAMKLFLDLTENGINVVTLSDGQVYRAHQTDMMQLIYSMAIMARANDESLVKSQRVGAAWKRKRATVAEQKLTKMAPAWLQLDADRRAFSLVPDRVDVVRRIFGMADEGMGTYLITKTLNMNGVTPFGRSSGWNESYVEKILKNRAVLGEYQPHELIDGKRRPVGDVVVGYFPSVVDETLFLAVQAQRRRRATGGGGRKGLQLKNLFTHVATCAYCGAPMRMVDKGSGPKGGRYLKCSAGVRGLDCSKKGWRYDDFEQSFLLHAAEVDLAAVLNAEASDKAAAEREQAISAAVEQLARLEIQRERFADLADDPDVDIEFIRAKLRTSAVDLAQVRSRLAALQSEHKAAGKKHAQAHEVQSLVADLKRLTGAAAYEVRSRVANRLRTVVTRLTVAVEGNRHRLSRVRAMMDAEEVDPAYRDEVLRTIDEVGKAGQHYNPTFTVTFADGTVRQATVSDRNPAGYLKLVHLDRDGDVSLVAEDQSARWGRPASPYPPDTE